MCAVVTGRIGDTLLVTPALRALRNHAASLTVLAHPQRTAILQNLPFVDRLQAISKRSAWYRGRLGGHGYAAAFCWGRDRPLLEYCLRVARVAVAFDHPEFAPIESSRLIRVSVPPDRSLHAVHERNLLIGACGIECTDPGLAWKVSPAEAEFADRWLSARVAGHGPLVGLQPMSFHTKAHRDWPMAHFIEVACGLVSARPGTHVVLLGDGAVAQQAAAFRQALGDRLIMAAGALELRHSAALMQRLDLYVGVDTGPTHIAGALRVPMVALYHPEYPARNLCPLDHVACTVLEGGANGMDDIGVGEVLAAALKLLNGGRFPEGAA